jgi:tartronate-semialdehyde synthase
VHWHQRPGGHRHDHRPVFSQADSIPILCITGQAPRARLYKEDFQAVDIESICQARHQMERDRARAGPGAAAPSSRRFTSCAQAAPGPVLIDLPFDVQMAEIEFDPDTYAPLPAYKPSRHPPQIEKAWPCSTRERPLIVGGRRHHQRRRIGPAGAVCRADRRARSSPR